MSLLGLKSFTDKMSKQITGTEQIKLTFHVPSLALTGTSYSRVIIETNQLRLKTHEAP